MNKLHFFNKKSIKLAHSQLFQIKPSRIFNNLRASCLAGKTGMVSPDCDPDCDGAVVLFSWPKASLHSH